MITWQPRTVVGRSTSLLDDVGKLYRILRRARDDSSRQRAADNRRFEALAEHVASLYVELFRLSRDIEEGGLSEAQRQRLRRITRFWQGSSVQVVSPEGAELTPELEELVDVIGVEYRPNLEAAHVVRVDQPIVQIGSKVFRGKVWIARPR